MGDYTRSLLTLAALWDLVNAAEEAMTRTDFRLWRAIRIEPEKWELHPWGDKGGGFWAIGLIGQQVLWYNDIEHGFNMSRYTKPGVIDKYWCNQVDLKDTIAALRCVIESGDGMSRFD